MAKIDLAFAIPKIGSAFLALLDDLKRARQNSDDRVEEALINAGAYITKKQNRWEEIVKERYQKGKKDGIFTAIVRQLDYLIGLYEILIWGEGEMGCPACKEYVPTFFRIIDGDEGVVCNHCFYKP